MKLTGAGQAELIKVAAIGVGIVALLMVTRKAAVVAGDTLNEVITEVGQAVNPASTENLIYRGVNAVGGTLAGDSSWTLGGWIYDITH